MAMRPGEALSRSVRLMLAACVAITLAGEALAQVRINEMLASNGTSIRDEDGDSSDWLELVNLGSQPVSLLNWGLSDSGNPFKWRFGDVTIQPGQHLLVWASGKNRTSGANIHASWSISAGGEVLSLVDASGVLQDQFPATAMERDLSMGRQPDGTGPLYFFQQPTPRAANTTTGFPTETLAQPTFSVAGGMHTGPVTVSISAPPAGATLRYTLDGSDPTESSSAYTGPITLGSRAGQPNGISMIPTNQQPVGAPYYEGWQQPLGEVYKINVLRARFFKANVLPSRITTQSYLIDPLGSARYPFPVVSISSSPDNLFSGPTGIYVVGWYNNFAQEGAAWERPGHIEFYESDGSLAFQGEVGIRIHGGTTVNRPRKSLRIYSRNASGNVPFGHRIFPDKDVAAFDTFLLRNSGNDWGQTIFRDAFVSSVAAPTGLDRQSVRPVVVFLDGEYWGIHNARDRFDEGFYLHHYGLDETEFTQLEICSCNGSWPVHDRGNESMLADFSDVLAKAGSGVYSGAGGMAALDARVDVGNFIDYSIHQIWCGNTDWPGNNVRLWRAVTPDLSPAADPRLDGRWRWLLYDTDFGLGLNFNYVIGVEQGPAHDTLAHATAANGSWWSNNEVGTRLLRRSLENVEFRNRFINRFADLLNTTLSADQAGEMLDAFVATYGPGMAEHVRRWRQPGDWNAEVARVRSYTQQRPAAVRGHIASKFGLAGTAELTVDVSDPAAGSITVNSVEIDPLVTGVPEDPWPWTGTYFRGVPVTVTASPRPGHRFVRWEDSATSGPAYGAVTTSPSPPVAGQPVTITYDPAGRPLQGASQVYLHFAPNAWSNRIVPRPAMTQVDGRWQHTYAVPAGTTVLRMVFTSNPEGGSGGVWDNNSAQDWNITVAASDSTVDPLDPVAVVNLSGSRTLRAVFEADVACPADLDGSRDVDAGDLSLLLFDFGPCEGCPADLDGNGSVDGGDISMLLLAFGPCPQ
ncbi:MAG: CotH kinase family protein [Phycisphaerales bacterium]|jgi:hypothetical protein